MIILDFKKSHLEEACELFMASYSRQREIVPILDESNLSKEKIMPMLEWCVDNHSGVTMYENGKMMGYMTGLYLEEFLGVHKGVLCPEWAHSSIDKKSFDIYRSMYQAIGQRWVENGCLTHVINFMDYTHEAQEAFSWNGFGRLCIDAVLAVEPIIVEYPEWLRISQIQEKDIPAWLSFIHGHNRHLAKSPTFKPYLELETESNLKDMLGVPGNYVWIAWDGDKAVGYMKVAPSEEGAAWIVNGVRNIAVNGAYVEPEYRGKGVAKLLLATIMEWAVKEGYKRSSVDFEATNPEASQFWLRYFQPVCRSMVRRLDERILKINK